MNLTYFLRRFLLMLSLSSLLGSVLVSAQSDEPEMKIIALGILQLSELDNAEIETWLFEGLAGQALILSAERYPPNPDSNLNPFLSLYAPDDTLLVSDERSGPGRDALIGYTLPADGLYRIEVENLTTWEGFGSYLLTVVENPFPEGCQSPKGAMFYGEMPSAIARYPIRYRVFMPPCYELEARRYPYIILMHGSNSSDELWDDLGVDETIMRGVALDRLPPMAVVLPWGGTLANTNVFNVGASWEYVVIDELIPYMEATYCLQNERSGRAIGGISRGGFWAFLIGFRNPSLFSSIGGHSPFFDLYHAPPSHNPLNLAQAPAPDPLPRIWMDRGVDDYAQVNIDLQHENLIDNDIPHHFELYSIGRHENAYWGAHVEDYLRFYSAEWPFDVAELPPC